MIVFANLPVYAAISFLNVFFKKTLLKIILIIHYNTLCPYFQEYFQFLHLYKLPQLRYYISAKKKSYPIIKIR